MTIVFGSTDRLGYDYFGDWTRHIDLHVSSPEIVQFTPDTPGDLAPGDSMPGGNPYREGQLDVEVE